MGIRRIGRTTQTIMIANLEVDDLPFGIVLAGHFGRWSSGTPPQSLLLPFNDTALAFLKTPLVGTSPSKWLKERFQYPKKGRS